MKFEKIRPGMVLYDVHRHKMGNTTRSSVGVWEVHVITVDAETRSAIVSWNTNTPSRWSERQISKLREHRPMMVDTGMGQRLATREEIKAAKAKEQ